MVAIASVGNGCSCSHNAGNHGDGGSDDMSVPISVLQLVGPPATGDMGTCIPDGTTCSTGGAQCCNGICCGNNTCGCIP